MFKATIEVECDSRSHAIDTMSRLSAIASDWGADLRDQSVQLGRPLHEGQRWQCMDKTIVIIRHSTDKTFPFRGESEKTGDLMDTYTVNGTVWSTSETDRDLDKLLPPRIYPQFGEYWVDVSGNLHYLEAHVTLRFVSYYKTQVLYYDRLGICRMVDDEVGEFAHFDLKCKVNLTSDCSPEE
jgi:hypothetical protein